MNSGVCPRVWNNFFLPGRVSGHREDRGSYSECVKGSGISGSGTNFL